MVVAAVFAGGRGARLGGDRPKQFLDLCGEPILVRCVRAFAESGLVDLCTVSVPADHLAETDALIDRFGLRARVPVSVIEGGKSRSDTLKKSILWLRAQGFVTADCVLLTHDAVRPFVTRRMIGENIRAAREHGACNTCIPATDTVFLSEDGRFITSVPDRSTVFHAQTPQSFRAAELEALVARIPEADLEALTDGCSIFTYFGKPVAMVPGDRDNIKITYPEDLEKARGILLRRADGAREETEESSWRN